MENGKIGAAGAAGRGGFPRGGACKNTLTNYSSVGALLHLLSKGYEPQSTHEAPLTHTRTLSVFLRSERVLARPTRTKFRRSLTTPIGARNAPADLAAD